MKKQLTGRSMFLFCLGDFSRAIFNGLTATYLMYIFIPQSTSSLPLLLPYVALTFAAIRGVGVIFDALIDPFIASKSDNCKHRLGARVPFLRYASLPMALFAVLMVFMPVNSQSWINAVWLLAMLLLYVLSVWTAARAARREQPAEETPAARPMAGWLMALMIVGGLAALVFGGEIFLHNAVAIARKLGVSESVIAITLVAGGTSLPELASSVVSLLKGKAEMALGNVIGSNISNILLILGLSATIHPLSMGGITVWDLLMVVLSSVLLFLAAFTFKRRAIDRWEGAIFLAIYVAYIGYLIR